MTVRLPNAQLDDTPSGRRKQHREIVDALRGLVSGSGGGGTGTVTTTGSPASGNLTKFSGGTSITNGDLSGDVTTSGTLATTIANGAVTLAKQANVATATVFYRKTAGAGAPEVQTLATLKTDLGLSGTNTGDQTTITGNAGSATVLATGRTIGITGDLTWTSPSFDGSGNVTAAGTIPNNTVTYAKMQDVSATKRVIGRNTAGSGDPEEVTVEQLFTWISGTPTQGDIFYRDSSAVARLGAGTSGQVLQTKGNAANPVWVGGMTFVAGAAVAGAAATTLTVSGLDLDAHGVYFVEIRLKNATSSAATISMFYNSDTTATNYFNSNTSNGASTQANNALIVSLFATTSAESLSTYSIARIVSRVVANGTSATCANSGTNIRAVGSAHQWTTTGTNVTGITISSSVASSLDIGSRIDVWRVQNA